MKQREYLVSPMKIFLILAAQDIHELAGVCYLHMLYANRNINTFTILITQQLQEIVRSRHSNQTRWSTFSGHGKYNL
jgi:hypothetical protein